MKNKIDVSAIRAHAPWHKESYDRFLNESLPRLIAQRLPLTGYRVSENGEFSRLVEIGVGGIDVGYDLFAPNDEGLFFVDEGWFVVVPIASDENLDTAEIKCVGEQFYDYVSERLGEAGVDLPWDEALVRAWLPLDSWIHEVVTSGIDYERWATGQPLDRTNTLAEITHLRRIIIANTGRVIAPGQFGRVCPFETPEGPNIGHIFSIATGARIRDGRIEVIDDRPEAALGVSASIMPFLEHNDPNRALMGVNMMRGCLYPAEPEPAIVQTGLEPNVPGIWTGRNLLTAFISMGLETYEDALLVSESAAKRLSGDTEACVGDKLHNRHGQKGVISRILPDDQMPRLHDGTPVDIACSFIGLHTRKDFGQIREAVMSRIARAEGAPAVVVPFHAPSEAEMKDRLRKEGLPEDGMEVLYDPRLDRDLDSPSCVGWVYWCRSVHTAEDKVHAFTHGPGCNRQSEFDYLSLRDMGCYENLLSYFNTCSNERPDAAEFVREIAAGPVEQAGPPTPKFAQLQARLSAAGIGMELQDTQVHFKFAPPEGRVLKLAQPMAHPWIRDRDIAEIGSVDDLGEYRALAEANAKLERAMGSGVPASLKEKAMADLKLRLANYFDSLVTPELLRMNGSVMFSGRTMLAAGLDLRLDQLGLADEIAWTIFGPLVIRELGDESEVEKRTERACRALDEIMANSWIILNRAPTAIPTALMAFHPVRIPENVIRLHPLVCFLMNADFDGDQAAVFLPITDAAQREAGEKLSLAGHLKRDPNLFELKLIYQEALWGLAKLGQDDAGLDEICALAGVPASVLGRTVDRDSIAAALRHVISRDGVEEAMRVMQRLFDRGVQVARESGASISPFVGSKLDLPVPPDGADPEEWNAYVEDITDILQSITDYSSPDLGTQLLATKSGARGVVGQLVRLVAPSGLVTDASGEKVPVRHSLRDGLSPEEMFAYVTAARERLASVATGIDAAWREYGVKPSRSPRGFGIIARAMRASHPGRVFARAAAVGECDPLTDLDSRLFVGLKPEV